MTAFLDETVAPDQQRRVHGLPVVSSLEQFRKTAERPSLICGTGRNALRRRSGEAYSDFEFVTLVHPEARFGPNTIVGAGAVVTRDLPGDCTAAGKEAP